MRKRLREVNFGYPCMCNHDIEDHDMSVATQPCKKCQCVCYEPDLRVTAKEKKPR